MNKNYYCENLEKNTKYRGDYVSGIDSFLERSRINAQLNRENYINPQKYFENPEKYRNDFINLLGYPLNISNCEKINSSKDFVASDKNVDIFRMQLEIMGIKFYGIYFKQANHNSETPFVMVLHGGEGTPELVSGIYDNSSNYNHLARRLTDKGCSVFCPQLLLWNIPVYGNEYNRSDVNNRLLMLGGSVTALEVFLLSQSISYFIQEENINPDKIGVAGLSYGGQFAIDLAACDKRIKVCHSSCYFNDRFIYPESDWCYPNALNRFNDAEKAALICPRALSVNVGNNDYLFAPDGAVSEFEKLKKYYEKFNADNKLDFYVFNGTHEEDKGDRWIKFMMKNL